MHFPHFHWSSVAQKVQVTAWRHLCVYWKCFQFVNTGYGKKASDKVVKQAHACSSLSHSGSGTCSQQSSPPFTMSVCSASERCVIPLELLSDLGLTCGLHGHLTHPSISKSTAKIKGLFGDQFFGRALMAASELPPSSLMLREDSCFYSRWGHMTLRLPSGKGVYVKMPSWEFDKFGNGFRQRTITMARSGGVEEEMEAGRLQKAQPCLDRSLNLNIPVFLFCLFCGCKSHP